MNIRGEMIPIGILFEGIIELNMGSMVKVCDLEAAHPGSIPS